MNTNILIQKYESFQPEIQKEIMDFIEYLEFKYKSNLSLKKKSWKREFIPIKIKGKITASQLIREERDNT